MFSLRRVFLKSVKVRDLEKVDPSKPIILAPNHQNALLDALLVTTSLKQQPVFLTRADIFEKPLIFAILRYFKMIPVYRIRDGYDSLKKNEEIFDQCVKYLGHGKTLILFPEGNHGDRRHFRPLKKGLARIAFEAEKRNDFNLGLQVIPVGIDYSDYRKFRSTATISFGEPIEMSSLKKAFDENPQKGMRQLNLKIAKGIEPHMIEIPWADDYDSVMQIRHVYSRRYHERINGKKGLLSIFDSHKKLIDAIGEWMKENPDKMKSLSSLVKSYFDKLKELKLRDHVVEKSPYSVFGLILKSLAMIILFPFYVYGLINNYLIFKIPDYFTITRIKDTQFRSSIAYVMAFVVLLPLLYTIQTIIVAIVVKSWWITLLYLASLIPSGLLAINYSFWFKKLWSRWKFVVLSSRNHKDIEFLRDSRDSIIKTLDEITA